MGVKTGISIVKGVGIMAKKKLKKGAWTNDDLKVLKKLFGNTLTAAVAKQLGRPLEAVKKKNPDKSGQEMRNHLEDIYEAVSRIFGYNLEIPVWGITPFLRKFKDQVD